MSWQALNWCASLHHVKGGRRALLWAMANRHNATTGLVTMGITGLANESGLSRSTAHRILGQLASQGLVLTVVPGAGTRATAYMLPCVASQPSGTQAPVDNTVDEPASVPNVSGSTDLASHSQDLASHPGWDETNKQPEVQPRARDAAPPSGVATRSNNGVPPDVAANLAAFRAELSARPIAERKAEAKRLRDLHGPPATEPRAREPPAA